MGKNGAFAGGLAFGIIGFLMKYHAPSGAEMSYSLNIESSLNALPIALLLAIIGALVGGCVENLLKSSKGNHSEI